VLNGSIGHARGTELAGYLQLYREKIDIDRIFSNPEKEPVPTEPEILFGVTVGLATRCKDEKDINNVYRFVKKVDPPYQMVFWSTLTDKKLEGIKKTEAWNEFILKYYSLIAD
jgi:hypothetical protein